MMQKMLEEDHADKILLKKIVGEKGNKVPPFSADNDEKNTWRW